MILEGFTDNATGFILALNCFFYFLFCIGYTFLFEKWPRKIQFVVAFFGFVICNLMIGPSEFLNLNDNLILRVFGFALLGAFQTIVFIPIIPEMLEHL